MYGNNTPESIFRYMQTASAKFPALCSQSSRDRVLIALPYNLSPHVNNGIVSDAETFLSPRFNILLESRDSHSAENAEKLLDSSSCRENCGELTRHVTSMGRVHAIGSSEFINLMRDIHMNMTRVTRKFTMADETIPTRVLQLSSPESHV